MKILLLFVCFGLLPIWGQRSNRAITGYSSTTSKFGVKPYHKKEFCDDLLVTTVDGLLHKISVNGVILWSSPLRGGSLVSSFHPTNQKAYQQSNDSIGTMIPSTSGSVLSYVGDELQNLDLSVKEFVQQTPKVSLDGLLYLGSKDTSVFAVDIQTGVIKDIGELSGDMALFARIDYLIQAVEAASGDEKWNFTFSELVPFEEMNNITKTKKPHRPDYEDEDTMDEDEPDDDLDAVSEVTVFADGSFRQRTTRGDRSDVLKPTLPASISSAFALSKKTAPNIQDGKLCLSDTTAAELSVVSLKQLTLKHHLKRSQDETKSTSLVAHVDSSSFNDHVSLFAVEYFANVQDLEVHTFSIAPSQPTYAPSGCPIKDYFARRALPSLPSRPNKGAKEGSRRILNPARLIGDSTQSASLSQVSPTDSTQVRGVGDEVPKSCHPGGNNYPACIVGLHLLDNTSEPITQEAEAVPKRWDSGANHPTHRHSLKPKLMLLLTMVVMVFVAWIKEHTSESPSQKKTPTDTPVDSNHPTDTPVDKSSFVYWLVYAIFQSLGQFSRFFYQHFLNPHRAPSTGSIDADGNLVVGNLRVSDEKIGHGSMGTIVFRAGLDGRPVAVKRMLQDYHKAATREMKLLIESDGHPNVVRYFVQETHGNFVYLAIELCAMSLHDAMEKLSMGSGEFEGELSPVVSAAMLEIVKGVAFLHRQRIVHRDIKPHNILLAPRVCSSASRLGSLTDLRGTLKTLDDLSHFTLKISDMGLGKLLLPGHSESVGRRGDFSEHQNTSGSVHGTVGWQAPEVVTGSSKPSKSSNWTRACSADIFSLGCVLYHMLKPGAHLFGEDWFERESNIVHSKPVGLANINSTTARALIKSMTTSALEHRPSADNVKSHPLFWKGIKKLNFLVDVSDRLELETASSPLVLSIEENGSKVFGESWKELIDPRLVDDANKFRTYDVTSVRALLRVIRNKRHHWLELPVEVQELARPFPEGLGSYFELQFPSLLYHCYLTMKPLLSADGAFVQHYNLSDFVSTSNQSDLQVATPAQNGADRPTESSPVDVKDMKPVDTLSSRRSELEVTEEETSELLEQQDQVVEETSELLEQKDQVVEKVKPVTKTFDIEQSPINNVVVNSETESLAQRGWSQSLVQWSAQSSTPLPPPLQRAAIDPKYRTRLCQHWDSNLGRHCPMRAKGKCDFAHGAIELRVKETKLHRWGTIESEEASSLVKKGTSGGEDTYASARNVERIRKVDGKNEVEKQKQERKKVPARSFGDRKKSANTHRPTKYESKSSTET